MFERSHNQGHTTVVCEKPKISVSSISRTEALQTMLTIKRYVLACILCFYNKENNFNLYLRIVYYIVQPSTHLHGLCAKI